jgi:hypothetical protein
MSGQVPSNQSVSWTPFFQAVCNGCGLPHDFVSRHIDRIERAFDMGETIEMVVEEMRMRFEERPRARVTPLQMARSWKAQGRT